MSSVSKRICIALGVMLLLFSAMIFVARRVTALQAARFVVQKAELPIDVRSANWDLTWNGLRRGEVNRLQLTAVVDGVLPVDLDTPVRFRWQKDQESLQLNLGPAMSLTLQPVALKAPLTLMGAIDLVLAKKKVTAQWDVTATKTFEHDFGSGQLALEGMASKGDLSVVEKTVRGSASFGATSFQALFNGQFLDAGAILLDATGWARLPTATAPLEAALESLVMKKPWPLRAKAKISDGHWDADVKGNLKAEELAKLLPTGITGKGQLSFTAHVDASGIQRSRLQGRFSEAKLGLLTCAPLDIDADVRATPSVQATARALRAVSCTLPLPLQGTLRWDKVRLAFDKGALRASGALTGEGFTIAEVQKALCLAPDRPLPGPLEFKYPDITVKGTTLAAKGHVRASILGGALSAGDITVAWSDITRASFSASLTDVNLNELAQWLNFGRVTGRLDIQAQQVEMAMTGLGMLPLQYDFSIKGSSDEGQRLNFSAEALDNLMDMMGVKDAASNPVASMAFKAWHFFGGVFGFVNNMDYFGFRARTERGFTTLTTFDPMGAKNHYLIHGMSFKMPIKSTGRDESIYPVIMRTGDFQSWLWARMMWFKSKNKESADEKNKPEECIPLL